MPIVEDVDFRDKDALALALDQISVDVHTYRIGQSVVMEVHGIGKPPGLDHKFYRGVGKNKKEAEKALRYSIENNHSWM